MKTAYLTLSVSRLAAGMLDCVRRPAQELHRIHGIEIDVLSVIDKETAADRHSWEPVPTRTFPAYGPPNLAFAPTLAAALKENSVDFVHTFGLWTYLSQITTSWAQRTGKPYLVTPQGMLDPWALSHSRWRKRAVGLLYEHRHLRHAACIHATCAAELDAIRAFGLRNPVCIVPNGVDLPHLPTMGQAQVPWAGSVAGAQKILLYLGRLHPKKGLCTLLRAWAALKQQEARLASDWTLIIAGWDQGNHAAELRTLAAELGIGASVHFAGSLYGEFKAAAYQHADAFVLPSLSEGLPLVVLEAWSHGLPVVMTSACNLPEGFAAEAALESGLLPAELTAALTKLISLDEAARRDMGARGRALVAREFTWSGAAAKLAQVYRWILKIGERPDCVSM